MTLLSSGRLPERFGDVTELEEFLTTPSRPLADDLAMLDGDILILGAGGKMGPTLAGLAKRAAPSKRVLAVARFSEPGLREKLHSWGVETRSADLLEPEQVAAIPSLPNVVFMAGRKFGTTGSEELTWAMNTLVPAIVAQRFVDSRFVVFSTGCVYPFMKVAGGGATEDLPPMPPPGEYANSCVGRERIFQYFSIRNQVPACIIRLNYAIDMRYGVLHDVAQKVRSGESIDLSVGHVNVIWQGDANAQALRTLHHCAVPARSINVSGPETVEIREVALAIGHRMNRKPRFEGVEQDSAWLVNTSKVARLLGPPPVPLDRMIDWVADWVSRDMPSLDKPTHYDARDGTY